MIAFVPLVIFSQYISPFHFGKVVIFRSIVEIMAVFYLVLIIKDRSYLPPKHILLGAVGLFTVLFGISTITSINPYLSFWGSLERMGGFWTFLHYIVYLLILVAVFRTKEDWLRLMRVVVFVGVLSAFYGFLQKTNWELIVGSGGRARIFGTIGNAALFAGYQVLNIFLALMLASSSWIKPREKGYFYLATLISTIAVLMTAVRGSILGVGVGFLIFAVLYFFTNHSKMAKKALVSLVILFVIFVGFSFAFKDSQFVKNSGYLSRVTDFSLNSPTVQTRFWAWQAGFSGWKETPKTILLGWGPENFNVPFSKHFNPQFYAGPGAETLFDRAHNMFVEILVTMGLLTFLAYVAMFVAAYRLIWIYTMKEQKIEKPIGIGLISLLTAYIIHNSFIFDTSANFLVFFTVIGFITYLTTKPKTETGGQIAQNTKHIGSGLWVLMLILLAAVTILIYKTNILSAKTNYTTTRGIVRSWSGDFDGAVAKFKEALSYDVHGKYEYRHRFAKFLLANLSGTIDENKKEAIEFAINEVQKNADETQQDYLPYLYLSRLYITLGKNDPASPFNDKALENSRKALEISPNFVRTYYEIAQVYLNKEDYSNAIKYFQDAVDLNPSVGISYWYLSATYLESGNVERGLAVVDDAIKNGYRLSENDTLMVLNIYIKQNNFQKIAEMFSMLIRLSPNNPQYHASLAVVYARLGMIDEAVDEARMSAQLDKSFESEARSFVQSLGRQF